MCKVKLSQIMASVAGSEVQNVTLTVCSTTMGIRGLLNTGLCWMERQCLRDKLPTCKTLCMAETKTSYAFIAPILLSLLLFFNVIFALVKSSFKSNKLDLKLDLKKGKIKLKKKFEGEKIQTRYCGRRTV